MRKAVFVFLIAGLVLGQVLIDVKMPNRYKPKFLPLKIGVIYFLKQAGFRIVEFHENLALWLDFIREEKHGDYYQYHLVLRLTQPSFLLNYKPSLIECPVSFSFPLKAETVKVDEGLMKFLAKKMKHLEKKEKLMAFFGGKIAAEKAAVMIRNYLNGAKSCALFARQKKFNNR